MSKIVSTHVNFSLICFRRSPPNVGSHLHFKKNTERKDCREISFFDRHHGWHHSDPYHSLQRHYYREGRVGSNFWSAWVDHFFDLAAKMATKIKSKWSIQLEISLMTEQLFKVLLMNQAYLTDFIRTTLCSTTVWMNFPLSVIHE